MKAATTTREPASPDPARAAPRRSALRGPLGLAFLLFALWAAAFIRRSAVIGLDGRAYFCLFDDAMISMRYAWNCAHGLGLVWNPGERVEGFTNFLMTVLMIPFTALLSKSAAVAAVQACGVATVLAAAALARRLAGLLAPAGLPPALRHRYELLCAAGVLAYYPLAFWSLMGMEAGLLSVLLLGALCLAFRPAAARSFSPGLAVLLGLAFWTRPDAALAIALILLYRASELFKPKTPSQSSISNFKSQISNSDSCLLTPVSFFFELLLLAFLGLALTLFRVFYYGGPVPNTYQLKLGGFPLAFRLVQGAEFIWPLFLQAGPALALGAVACWHRPSRPRALLGALVVLMFAYPVWIGGDCLPFWRLSAPAFPALLVLALGEAARLSEQLAARRRAPTPAAALALAFILILAAADAPFLKGITLIEPASKISSAPQNVNTALLLNELTGPGATVAVGWGGIIPYYTGRRAIDLLGKCDPYVAALPPDLSGACAWLGFRSVPGHNKYDLNHSIVQKRPTYVQCFNWGRQDVSDFARAHYIHLKIAGVDLALLNGSPEVFWNKLPR